tara:strand:- start:619 stop:2004 length:1386 start_codon:yes stop_codon:yes gene_type:complete
MNVSFASLSLAAPMLENLAALNFNDMTPIQAQSLPPILEGKDVIAQAKTGSGKTVAFGIGVINKLEVKSFQIQALVLCPTRELADQVAKEIRRLARVANNIKVLTLCGGASMRQQESSLSHSAHVVVGTPGRVLKHLNQRTLHFNGLTTLVLDEADRMLDMGFNDEISDIISYLPSERQTMLFSATYPLEIASLSGAIQNNPITVKTEDAEQVTQISETFYEVFPKERLTALLKVFSHYKPENVIVFCNTKLEVKSLTQELNKHKIGAMEIHGDLEQYQRNDVLVQFSNKSCSVLVATDVAARGLDIKNLSMVVNMDLPHDETTYTHRIGRTGRAGCEGVAITLYSPEKALVAEQIYQNDARQFNDLNDVPNDDAHNLTSPNKTLVIEVGKKDKIRPGDILGALTGECEISNADIGKIDVYATQTYVAISSKVVHEAQRKLAKGKIKKLNVSVWFLTDNKG